MIKGLIVTAFLVGGAVLVAESSKDHAVEIKTSRKLNGKAISCDYASFDGQAHCREIEYNGKCPLGTSCTEQYDYHREIWIDGVKWGTLKEAAKGESGQ